MSTEKHRRNSGAGELIFRIGGSTQGRRLNREKVDEGIRKFYHKNEMQRKKGAGFCLGTKCVKVHGFGQNEGSCTEDRKRRQLTGQ